MKKLYLILSTSIFYNGCLFDNIDQPEININEGDKVSHKSFGEGILISYKPLFMDIELTVKFEEPTGMKKIMKNKAPIKITKSTEESSPEDYYGI